MTCKQVILLFYVCLMKNKNMPYMKQYVPQYFLCMLILASCNEAGLGKKQFEFYYYPSKNVYYDVANNQYTYSVDGGKTWNNFKPNTSTEFATLGSRQTVYSDDEQPWKLNQVHRKEYNGTLLSIADADTVAQQQDVITDKKIIVKKPKLNVDQAPQEEKKPGFFKRLFGGKKHNNNQ